MYTASKHFCTQFIFVILIIEKKSLLLKSCIITLIPNFVYVQISGIPYLVKMALYVISTYLHLNPDKENLPPKEILHASTYGGFQSLPAPYENPMWGPPCGPHGPSSPALGFAPPSGAYPPANCSYPPPAATGGYSLPPPVSKYAPPTASGYPQPAADYDSTQVLSGFG